MSDSADSDAGKIPVPKEAFDALREPGPGNYMDRRSAENDALTEEQVAALPEGTPITVIWSGGNGPHDYVIAVNKYGQRFAAGEGETNDRMRFYNPLHFTGLQRYHTRVWTRPIPPGEGA